MLTTSWQEGSGMRLRAFLQEGRKMKDNRSRGYNARFTATYRTVSVHRVLQMRGGGYADVLPVLQVPDNKADAVPCERLR